VASFPQYHLDAHIGRRRPSAISVTSIATVPLVQELLRSSMPPLIIVLTQSLLTYLL